MIFATGITLTHKSMKCQPNNKKGLQLKLNYGDQQFLQGFGLIQMSIEDKFCLTFKKRGNIITVNE